MGDDCNERRGKSWDEEVWVQGVMAIMILVGAFLALKMISVRGGGIRRMQQNAVMQVSRQIGLAMFAYATDYHGTYPTGKSSTEVFQKLIDENYISDPSIFWIKEMPGKRKATSNRLKPENVCWDVTITVDGSSSDDVPVVFLTGYKVIYAPGAPAVPLFMSSKGRLPGMAVGYKSNSVKFIREASSPAGIIPGFIPSSFAAGGKTYQQLTPDGPMPP